MKLSKQVLEGFLRLNAPEFSSLRTWLAEQVEETKTALVELSDAEQLRRYQGRAQVLLELQDFITNAPKYMEKISTTPRVARETSRVSPPGTPW
jgi:hypothetical protein